MDVGKILEEPGRATAAPYWDLTGLTGVELGRPKKLRKLEFWCRPITMGPTKSLDLLWPFAWTVSKDREDHG